MRISDWSSDVGSSDLFREVEDALVSVVKLAEQRRSLEAQRAAVAEALRHATNRYQAGYSPYLEQLDAQRSLLNTDLSLVQLRTDQLNAVVSLYQALGGGWGRSEEHTSELQSLMRLSYAVFCLKKKTQ